MEVAVPGAGNGFITTSVLLSLLLLLSSFSGIGAFIGVNVNFPVGALAGGGDANFPRAEHVVDLLNILQIQQIKLREDVHPSLLHALSGTKLKVAVTFPNQLIHSSDASATSDWLREHVLRFLPGTHITTVVVGDRYSTPPPAKLLVKAMRNVYNSLRLANLENYIKVTSSVPSYIISELVARGSGTSLHPSATFMHELLTFLAETNSPLMINVNLYEKFKVNKVDKLNFPELSAAVDAALDSAYAAVHSLGFSNVPLVIGSIGWPWKGGESSASPETAATFVDKLVSYVQRPGTGVHVYVDELLDVEESSGEMYGMFGGKSLAGRYKFDVVSGGEVIRRELADGTGNGTSTGGSGQYCVAKPNTPDNILSVGLNWACGQGNADCTQIQQNGPCYLPDTYASHASYAFNSYYQKNAGAGASCDFNGAAQLVSTDPSYNSCIYTSSTGSGGTGSSVGSGPSSNGGILQPFNPPGNNSGARAVGVDVAVMSVVVVLTAGVLWSWRV